MKKNNLTSIYTFALLGVFIIFTNACKKGSDNLIPVLTTIQVSEISQTTATCGGIITFSGSSSITERRVCWNTNQTPTITDNKTINETGEDSFTSKIVGLAANTTYYVRAYASNSEGTAYGNEVSFTTTKASQETVVDIDGNVYHTVIIGNQVWMVENLKTTKYRNGDLIGTTIPATLDISEELKPKFQWAYNGDDSKSNDYGRLYTWYAVSDSRNICPDGWHVPTIEEFTTLINNIGGEDVAGTELLNVNGFKALMGGYRYYTDHFLQLGTDAHWWTSTDEDEEFAYKIYIELSESSVVQTSVDKKYGLAVRCIKD